MNDEEPIKPQSTDPLEEAISHPNGPDLDEMLYGKEEENYYPSENETDVAEQRKRELGIESDEKSKGE